MLLVILAMGVTFMGIQKRGLKMLKVTDVAQHLMAEFQRICNEPSIDELKLQKLLYLAQRESYAVFGKPLFAESMQGWKRGPVSVEVHESFEELLSGKFTSSVSSEVTDLLDNVVRQYGEMDANTLVNLTHQETSWKNARTALSPDERGSRFLTEEDVIFDARKVQPYRQLNDAFVKITPVGEYAMPRRTLQMTREDAEERLDLIAGLEDGWRGPGTAAFSEELIGKVRAHVAMLPVVPLPVPSVRGGIQLEFEDRAKGFLAILLFDDDRGEVYAVSPTGAYEAESVIRREDVQERVQAFQEGRLWRS